MILFVFFNLKLVSDLIDQIQIHFFCSDSDLFSTDHFPDQIIHPMSQVLGSMCWLKKNEQKKLTINSLKMTLS